MQSLLPLFTGTDQICWSDHLDEPVTDEEAKKNIFFNTSLQRLLDWQASVKEKTQLEQKRKKSDKRSLSIEIPSKNPDTMSWSSAATGKPQLTYAERLRRAKEGPRSVVDAADGEEESILRDNKVDSEKPSISTFPSKSSLGINSQPRSMVIFSPTTSSRGETGTTTSPAISSSNSPTHPPPSSVSSAQSPSAPAILAAHQVNVWEARRLQLQEMVKKADNQTFEGSNDIEPNTASMNSTRDATGKDHVISEPSRFTNELLPRNSKENGTSSQDLVGNQNTLVTDDGRLDTNASRVDVKNNITNESKSEEKSKASKASKKKKQNINNQKQQNAPADIPFFPPLSDSVNWPSPNDAKEHVQQSSSPIASQSTTNLQASSSGEQKYGTQATKSHLSNGSILEQLDVEILRQPGPSDKLRKGKQWIPIVPTITNPPPNVRFSQQQQQQQQQQQKNSNKSQGGNRWTTDHAYIKALNERRSVSDPQSTAPQSRLLRNDEISRERSFEDQSSDADLSSVETGEHKDGNEKVFRSGKSQKTINNDTNSQSNPPFDGQRRKSGIRTPRGARGRGGSKRSSDNEASTPSVSTSASQRDDNAVSVNSDVKAVEGSGESFKSSQRRDTLPNSRQPPSGPRYNNQGAGGSMRRSTVHSMNTSERQFYDPNMMFHGHPPPPMFNASPFYQPGFGPPGPYYPFGNGMPFVESTPAELAPKGTTSTSEPTSALLWQIEFYFSHQNLQGDFYLRKMMDSQGFVPIETLASFNRVKRLANDNIDLINETIKFSKTLQISEDGTKIRKAFGWEPYVLVEGQHVQQWHSPAMPPPPFPPIESMAFQYSNGIPLSPLQMPPAGPHETMRLPNMNGIHHHHQSRNMNFTGQHNQLPPLRYPSMVPSQQNQDQDEIAWMNGQNSIQPEISESMTRLVKSMDDTNLHGGLEQGEEDDEEPQLGVVAATGLGGALNSTNGS